MERMGLQKYYNKYLDCLDETIRMNENELKMINSDNLADEKVVYNNSNTFSNKAKKRFDLKLKKKNKKDKARKYRRTVISSRKKIKKICNYKARSFCKLNERRKQNFCLKKKYI